jgi:hypothetical protein
MMCEMKTELSETPVIDGEQPTAPPAGMAVPVTGFETLKKTAQLMIDDKHTLNGLNPHKVKRLCEEYERLKAACEISRPTRARAITSLSWLVAEAKHRFDDCKGNLDNGSAGGYPPKLTEAVELLAELKEDAAGIHGQDGHATGQ